MLRLVLVLALVAFPAYAFQGNPVSTGIRSASSYSSMLYTKSIGDGNGNGNGNGDGDEPSLSMIDDRRSFMSRSTAGIAGIASAITTFSSFAVAEDEPAVAAADEESMSSITARATKLSADAGDRAAFTAITNGSGDTRTAYDFELPIEGVSTPFRDIIRQNVDEEGRVRCKVILVSNMKEDDPVARKDIPEFIALATKYGRNGEFAVVMSPSDQGYYEPDTSQLVRLKLESEYGWGINPSTVVTDKVDLLGKRALPFWRWMQSNCRTPAGLGRVEANFEKFLIDGRTGIPLRRYPRKYKPTNMKNDIEAILAGRPLPPAGANFLEEWRTAAVAAEADTYRFQKGLNYYD
jgi:glutathione peroxidase-family protein